MEELEDNFILKNRLRPLADAREDIKCEALKVKRLDKMVAEKEVGGTFRRGGKTL
jgi:hypothetical protein